MKGFESGVLHPRWRGGYKNFGSPAWASVRVSSLNATLKHAGKPLLSEGADRLLEVVKVQGNRCAGCGRGPGVLGQVLHIDHDASTGKIRGLLCAECNHIIGKAHDRSETLYALASYLERP